MLSLTLFGLVLCAARPATALESGGFGGPGFHFSGVAGELRRLGGLGGGWLINRELWIGGAGYMTDSELDYGNEGRDYDLNLGYGGLWIGRVFSPEERWSMTFDVLVGGGGLSLTSEDANDKSRGFFLIAPSLGSRVSALSWLHLGLGLGYRFIFGLSGTRGFDRDDLEGITASLFVAFGEL